MIRQHLVEWFKNLKVNNQQEFYDEVAKLPVSDRECALAMWGAMLYDNSFDKLATAIHTVVLFHDLDSGRLYFKEKGIEI